MSIAVNQIDPVIWDIVQCQTIFYYLLCLYTNYSGLLWCPVAVNPILTKGHDSVLEVHYRSKFPSLRKKINFSSHQNTEGLTQGYTQDEKHD